MRLEYIKMKKPVAGDVLFAVKRFHKKTEFVGVEVKKVGRDYAYLGVNGQTKISLSYFDRKSFFDGDWEIFESEQSYKDDIELAELKALVLQKVSKITDLEKIKFVISAIDA